MKKHKWIFPVIFIVVVISFGIFINTFNFSSGESNKNIEISTTSLNEYMESAKAGKKYLYFGRPDCQHCANLTIALKSVYDEIGDNLVHINVNNLTNEDFNNLSDFHDIFKSKWGVPLLMLVEDGKIIRYSSGELNTEEVRRFFNLENRTYMKEINYSNFEKNYYDDKIHYTFLGYNGCVYCQRAKPLLEEIAEELNFEIKYLKVDMINADDFLSLQDLDDTFIEFGVPLIIKTKNGKLINSISGYQSKENFINFFE